MSDPSDSNAKTTPADPSTLSGKLSLRREKIKLLRVKSEIKTGEPCEPYTQFSCTILTCGKSAARTIAFG